MFLTLAVLHGLCSAQNSGLFGRPIVDIQYSPADVLHPADLERVQPLKKGALFRAEDVSEAVDRLFATGCFEDIVAEAEPSGNGLIVRFVTVPTRFLSGVSVDGKIKQPPNDGQIVSTSQLQLGAPFHEEDITHAVNRLKRVFSANEGLENDRNGFAIDVLHALVDSGQQEEVLDDLGRIRRHATHQTAFCASVTFGVEWTIIKGRRCS